MKKYIKHFFLVILFIFALSSLMYNCFTQDVSTVYKREMFINRIKPGTKILSEKEIDGYIISGFELSSNEYGLAVFKPEKNHHKFQSCMFNTTEHILNTMKMLDAVKQKMGIIYPQNIENL